MQNEIREDMLKLKRMISDVEITIGKREGETELVNKLIDAENLLTYCMSRLENAIVPPCKVGDTVYYLNTMYHMALKKNKVYEAKVVRIVTTNLGTCLVIQIRSDDGGCCEIPDIRDFSKTVFLTREEAAKALKGGAENG